MLLPTHTEFLDLFLFFISAGGLVNYNYFKKRDNAAPVKSDEEIRFIFILPTIGKK